MAKKSKAKKKNIWYTIASFVVDKRKIITILFLLAIVYSVLSINRVTVVQDIKEYLPDDSETKQGLSLMSEEFTTYATAQVMISNVTYQEAENLAKRIEKIDHVSSVTFGEGSSYYKGTNALLTVSMDDVEDSEASIGAKADIKKLLKDYDAYIYTEIGYMQEMQEMLTQEMSMILVWAVIIIIGVLLLSTKAYMQIPVLLITFGVAAILNMGTNYWFGSISFVTNAVAVVLQLALAIDYAIILSDRFMEEHEHLGVEEAVKVALSKAIPEISSSSLTTVSGMVAMILMQFKLGYDMGIVLVKAILISLICVFLLMPGILVYFADKIDKTQHKCYVPKIDIIGKYAVKTKKIIPPIFLVAVILGFIGTSNCSFLYDVSSVDGSKKDDYTLAREAITDVFGASNQLVIMVPKGDYEAEKKTLEQVAEVDGVTMALGLSNQEIADGITLTDKMTPRQFAELTDVDLELIEAVYGLYAYDQEDYGPIVTDIEHYGVPMIDMFMFLYEKYEDGYVTLDEEMDEMLTALYDQLSSAQDQLVGEHYVRMILNLDLPTEGQATYDVMEEIRGIAETYYGEGNVVLVGNSTSTKDLETSFATDNLVISIMTALFVFLVLLFTFQNWGLPIFLVLTIQGSIWINFAIPTLMNQGVYFIGYLIVSAIQMGATIDYAIVIANRYIQLRKEEEPDQAIKDALNQAFPTIFTSGTIMISAGYLMGYMTSNVTIQVFAIALGRGAMISVLMVLLVLPQILLFTDKIVEKTKLSVKLPKLQTVKGKNLPLPVEIKGQKIKEEKEETERKVKKEKKEKSSGSGTKKDKKDKDKKKKEKQTDKQKDKKKEKKKSKGGKKA